MHCKYRIKPEVKDDFKDFFFGLFVFSMIFAILGLIGYILSMFGLGLMAGDGAEKYMILELAFYVINGLVTSLFLIIILTIIGVLLTKTIESIKGIFEVCPEYQENQKEK